jgi:putative membrane protein
MGWWAVPIVVLVIFTLYGIDGIASQLEDPFGYDRNDIKTDFIVEDIRCEIAVLVEEWKRVGQTGGDMFVGEMGRVNGFGSGILKGVGNGSPARKPPPPPLELRR